MRPTYLPRAGVWVRTSATLAETPAQRACAIEHAHQLERAARWPERVMYALAAVLFVYWIWM